MADRSPEGTAPTEPLSRQEELRRLTVKSFQEGSITVEEARAILAAAEEEERTWAPPIERTESGFSQEEIEERVMNPGTGTGAYASRLIVPEKPALPPEEAIPALYESMKPYRKFLTAILEACREEAATEAVDAAVEPEYEFCACVYSPISLRKMLVEAGALEYLEPPLPEEDEVEEQEGLPPDDAATEEPAAPAQGNEFAEVDVDEAVPETFAYGDEDEDIDERPGAFTEEAPEEEAEEAPVPGSIYDREGYLVIEDEPEGTWKTTEAGLAYLASINPEKQFAETLEKHRVIDDVFYSILEYCAEEPRNITDIVEHFDSDPRLGPQTYYASYVVDRLEEIGALVWKKNWMPTELGYKLLAERTGE